MKKKKKKYTLEDFDRDARMALEKELRKKVEFVLSEETSRRIRRMFNVMYESSDKGWPTSLEAKFLG